jgi:hypothetical protein
MPSSLVVKSAIELLATTYGFNPEEALRLCAREVEDWPKNLTPAPAKAAAPEGIKWASKRAQEEAETLGVRIPKGFVSESASGKVTLEDVRTFARDQGRLAANLCMGMRTSRENTVRTARTREKARARRYFSVFPSRDCCLIKVFLRTEHELAWKKSIPKARQ